MGLLPDWIAQGLGVILKPITTIVNGWQQRKTAQLQSDIQILQAKTEATIAKAKAGQLADINWDQAAVSQMEHSWKDEWFTVMLSIPLVMCFIPGLAHYVEEGFFAINGNVPTWWQQAFMAAVAASFGVRKLIPGAKTLVDAVRRTPRPKKKPDPQEG